MDCAAPFCDSCCALPAVLHCKEHAARLCVRCDRLVHGTENWHERAWICDQCMSAPSSIYCMADRAVMCPQCDHSMHPVNVEDPEHRRVQFAGFSWSPTMDDAITEGHVLSLVSNPQDILSQLARSLATGEEGPAPPSLSGTTAQRQQEEGGSEAHARCGWYGTSGGGRAGDSSTSGAGDSGATEEKETTAADARCRSEARSDDSSCTQQDVALNFPPGAAAVQPEGGVGAGPAQEGSCGGGRDGGESKAATSQLVGGAPLPPYAPATGDLLRDAAAAAGLTRPGLAGAALPPWQLTLAPPGKLLYGGGAGPSNSGAQPSAIGTGGAMAILQAAAAARVGGGLTELPLPAEQVIPGRCGPEERRGILEKFRAKRERRGKVPQVRYKARQVRAGGRVRIQGRFASNAELAEMARERERELAAADATRQADSVMET